MREPHLDLLAFSSRHLEGIGIHERPGNVSGVLMDVARDPTKWDLRAAQRFEFAAVAIMLPRQIEQRGSIIHQCPGCRQGLTRRAVVDVVCRIISKVTAREGAIISLRLVEHGDMWRDTLLLDQPVQHRGSPVGGIGRKPLRLETEAILCSLDHGPRRADFGLANGAGRLHVNDDTELHVDEIVVGVSKECRPLGSSGPLGRGIGRRDELRNNVAGGASRRIVESRQILLHCAA